jgi:hypothetical protein
MESHHPSGTSLQNKLIRLGVAFCVVNSCQYVPNLKHSQKREFCHRVFDIRNYDP